MHGKEVSTETDSLLVQSQVTDHRKTVAFEARLLRALLLKLIDFS